MTLQGAIQELHDMRGGDDFPFYYKPVIDKVIETLQMDAQEVRHGLWEDIEHAPDGLLYITCSVCGKRQTVEFMSYCGNCGAKMESKKC